MLQLRAPLDNSNLLPWENEGVLDVAAETLPTVSIVIPIYNSGAFLEKTLRSLLCNDLSGVELILMDGGSSDNTMQIVEHYRDIFAHVYSGPDKGQSDAINKGYLQASGDILYWLNGDDIILPNTLNRVREYFYANQHCEVLVGNAYMTEIDFSPINHFIFSPEKLKFNYLLDYANHHLIQPSVFFTRRAWEKSGPLSIDNHYAMDADLFIGMSKYYELHHLDIDVAYSVYHEDCKTRGARAESITSLALVQAKHGGMTEASKTLAILVDLYRQLEQEASTAPVDADSRTKDAKIRLLEARLSALENHAERQREIMLLVDLEQNG